MSRHVLTTVAVAVLSLSVLGPPVQAQDNQSAQELADLSALAEAGATEAQYSIGVKYDTGDGVPQDDAEAVRWYRLAAEQGHVSAQNNLGVMYGTGRGVPQDDAEAVRWYRLAAEQGDVSAQNNLGVMYDDGLGVPLDDAEAVRWYRLAAEQGDVSAQNNLGVMYSTGEGVPQDNIEAHMWLNLAASRSSGADRERSRPWVCATRGAPGSLTRSRAPMTPADLSEAQRRARGAGLCRVLIVARGKACGSSRSARHGAGVV